MEFCKEIAKGQAKRKNIARSRSPILEPAKNCSKNNELINKPNEIEKSSEERNNSLYQASFMQIYNTYLSLMLANPALVDVLASHFLGESYREKLIPKSIEAPSTSNNEQTIYQDFDDLLKSMKTIFPDLSISKDILEKGLEPETESIEQVKISSNLQSVFPNMNPPL